MKKYIGVLLVAAHLFSSLHSFSLDKNYKKALGFGIFSVGSALYLKEELNNYSFGNPFPRVIIGSAGTSIICGVVSLAYGLFGTYRLWKAGRERPFDKK
ncbi:MAG: hypothetical protein WC707_00805 [Candidatus Babeliaceae bacterium]|jgi:hypothetical protein